MDTEQHETPEQQKKIREALDKTMKSQAQSQTDFDNAWRRKLERKLKTK